MSVFTKLLLTAVGTAAVAGAAYLLKKSADGEDYDLDDFDEDFDEDEDFEEEDSFEETASAEEAPAEEAPAAEEVPAAEEAPA